MDIIVAQKDLLKGIRIVQNAVTQKSSLPILSNVLLETTKTGLHLTTTDLDIRIQTKVPAEVIKEGSITLPAKKFFEVVNSLSNEADLAIKNKDCTISIKSGKSNFKLKGLPALEYPQLSKFKKEDTIVIDQLALKEMFDSVDFAISKEDMRYVLNGLYFVVSNNNIKVVATDGRRLAVVQKKLSGESDVDVKVIIPTKTIQEVKRLFEEEGEIEIRLNKTHILFKFKTSFVLSRLIEGEYPDYKRVIPEKSSQVVKVSREVFLSAMRRARIFISPDSVAVQLNIKKEKMIISKTSTWIGECKEDVKVDYTGEDIKIGFNPEYIIDVLRTLSEDEVMFEINDSNKPAVVRKSKKYIYVILPMQIIK